MSPPERDYSRYPLRGLIREVPLKTNEKVLLFVIASHEKEKSFASVDTLRRQTGIGRTTFYRLRQELIGRGILKAREASRPGGATTYTIDRTALERLLTSSGRGVSAGGTRTGVGRHTGPAASWHTSVSHDGSRSRTEKKNEEDILNLKTPRSAASAGTGPRMRRARPKRRAAPSTGPPRIDDGTRDKKAALRARIDGYNDRRS